MSASAAGYDALVTLIVNIAVNLLKGPLFGRIQNTDAQNTAIRLFAFVVAAVVTAAFAASGDANANSAMTAAAGVLTGGGLSMAIFHAGQRAPTSSGPATSSSLTLNLPALPMDAARPEAGPAPA